MRPPLSLIPMLPLTLSYVCGILVSLTGLALPTAFIACFAAVIAVICRRSYVAALLIFVAVGFVNGYISRTEPPDDYLFGSAHIYSGVIDNVVPGESVQTLYVDVDSVDGYPCRQFKMAVYEPSHELMFGRAHRMAYGAVLSRITPRKDLPDEIDPADALASRGVVAMAFVPPDSIQSVSPEPGILEDLRRLSDRIVSVIASSGLDDDAAGLVGAMLTGDRSLVNLSSRIEFSKAGLAHVLALSGLHVGVLAWIISMAMYPLYIAGLRRTRFVIIILALWAFAAMTGFGSSVVRAVIMSTVFLAGEMFSLRRSPINTLALAAFLILMIRPLDILSPGFQMSFLAVLSVLAVMPAFRRIAGGRSILYRLLSPLVVSLAAMAGTGVVAAFYFHIFPVYFLLSNAVVGLLLPVLLVGGVLLVVASLLSMPYSCIVGLLDFVSRLIVRTASFFGTLPGAAIDSLYVDPAVMVFYFLSMMCLVASLYVRPRLMLSAFVATAMCGVVAAYATTPDDAGEAVWLTRNNRSTDIVVKSGHVMYLVTTARSVALRDEALDRARFRYSDFMKRRGVDSLTIAPDHLTTGVLVRRDSALTFADGRSLVLVSDDYSPPVSSDSLWAIVVCRGFRGDVVGAAHDYGAGMVVLSADLDTRRHNRYRRELISAGVRVVSMKDEDPAVLAL